MPSRTSPLEDKLAAIPKIFDQAQNTTANHSKNHATLYKLHLEAAQVTGAMNTGKDLQLTGERAFEDACIEIVNRVLVIKKGEAVADRVVKFVVGYAKFSIDKSVDNADEDNDTPASRFINRLLRHFLKGFTAKDKNVRFRCAQFLAGIVGGMDEIDDELYSLLRSNLLERVRDKEAPIRVQAVIALCKLAGSEDPNELDEDEISIEGTLIDILRYDTSPEVRRVALLNIPPSPRTVKHLLARSRDVDTIVRKLLYSTVLMETLKHPKQLSIAQREQVVRLGLGDRDPSVRAAAGKLIASWVDTLDGSLEEFIRIFDLVGEVDGGGVAGDALKCVFQARPDILDECDFNEAYWDSLTPAKAFLARVFVEHCLAANDMARVEATLPVVTSLAFKIQASYNALLERVQQLSINEDRDEEDVDEQQEEMEFVIGEMLRMAVHLDYADEIGRRKMFSLVREMISQEALPQSLVTKCLDVMRNLSPSERDLIRVIVEVIQELRDTASTEKEEEINEGDATTTQASDSPRTARTAKSIVLEKEMSEDERKRSSIIDLRCLDLCHGMLERVNGVRAQKTFEENSTLEGVLADLIVPAVKRKEFALREKGLICLALLQRMALNSFQLFLSQVQNAPAPLKLPVLQVVFDILMIHGSEFLTSENAPIPSERIVEFLLYLLQTEEEDSIQGVLVVGISKLMLSGLIFDEKVLKSLIATFFSPDTANNQKVRQCLSYFFPAYCYSSSHNQRQVQKASLPILQLLYDLYREVEDDGVMVTPAQIALHLVDWTDPQKAVDIMGKEIDHTIHFDFAVDIMKTLCSQPLTKDLQKIIVGLLGKLHLPEEVADGQVYKLSLLMDCVKTKRPRKDAASKNAFSKFEKAFTKRYHTQLEQLNETDVRNQAEFAQVFNLIDQVDDNEEEEIELPAIKKRSQKSRSVSVSTASTADSEEEENSTPRGSPQPTRRQPPRTPKVARKAIVTQDLSDEDDDDDTDDDSDVEETPKRPSTKKAPQRKPIPKGRGTRKAPSPSITTAGSDSEKSASDEVDEVDEMLL